jgi:hypothetical protein
MLKDIAGNVISSLGSGAASAPSTIFTPSQILGTGLTIWYDFNDVSTLYSNSAGTINVANTGDYILYVKNKATDRPNYDLRKAISSNLPLSAFSATTDAVLIFKKSALNTNKNTDYIYHNGATSGANNPILSLSSYTTTGKSAFTWSAVMRATSNTFIYSCFNNSGFQARFNLTFTNNNNISITIGVSASLTTNSVTIPCNLTKSNGYFYFTMTVDQNKNGIYYLNDRILATTATTVLQYPIITSTNQSCAPYFGVGGSSNPRANINTEITEYIFNDSEVLTPDQVFKLHQYYTIKYNLPMS